MEASWQITLEISMEDEKLRNIIYNVLVPDARLEGWVIENVDGKIRIVITGTFSLSVARGVLNGLLRQVKLIEDIVGIKS